VVLVSVPPHEVIPTARKRADTFSRLFILGKFEKGF
jgi:hypothetical protein